MQNQNVSLRTQPRLAPPPRDEGRLAQRGYLVICLAIYGGSLGAASLLVNFLSRTKYPDIPAHMELAPTLPADASILVNLSGRGDKDMDTVVGALGAMG